MRVIRLVVTVLLLPLVLVACQNTYSTSNNYAATRLAQPAKAVNPQLKETTEAQPKKATNPLAALLASNEASSKAFQNTALAKKTSKPVAKAEPEKKLTPKQKLAQSRKEYATIIAKHAKANGVPVDLAMAVVQVESNYRPGARGRAGEIGLMQLLPKTARYIGYEGEMQHLYNPDTNIQFGMQYLGKAHRLGGGSTCKTILKYNAGHGAKRMNKTSRHYCSRVRQIMQQT